MKVAFYLPNKFCYADCSNVDLGNPGIGGTEYMIIALAYHLSICQKKHEILIFAQHDTQLPQHCSIDGNELSNRGHFIAVAHLDAGQRFQILGCFGFCLNHYTIHLTETVEVRSIQTAEVSLHGAEDIAWTDACLLTSSGVDVQHVLREVRVEARLCGVNFRTWLPVRHCNLLLRRRSGSGHHQSYPACSTRYRWMQSNPES